MALKPKKIIQKDHPVLRTHAAEISRADIGSAALSRIITEMQSAMATRADAVAIAAPQLGYPLRLFIVSGKVFKEQPEESEVVDEAALQTPPDQIFINPKITKRSRKKEEMDEGCLSVDGLYGKTKRATKVSIEAFNERGEKISRGATGLLAQIFQHEVDHLDGILFIDHAVDVWELSQEELEKRKVGTYE